MKSQATNAVAVPALNDFLKKYILPRNRSDKSPLERAEQWLTIINETSTFYPDADPYQLRVKRRNARQNLRRILQNNPDVLVSLAAKMEGR